MGLFGTYNEKVTERKVFKRSELQPLKKPFQLHVQCARNLNQR